MGDLQLDRKRFESLRDVRDALDEPSLEECLLTEDLDTTCESDCEFAIDCFSDCSYEPFPDDGEEDACATALTAEKDLSRKEEKAIDREIPWRNIVNDPAKVKLFVQACDKEGESWQKYGPVRPLSPEETRRILQDPRMRKRIMKSRAAYRDKNAGKSSVVKAKCRVVLLG